MADLSTPRRMWSLFEPVHAVTYFSPVASAAFVATGLRGFWRGYFAGRAAPLGPVGAEPVIAAFFGFAPSMVRRALPDVWTLAAPDAVLPARRTGARDALRAVLAGIEPAAVREAADLLRAAAGAVDLPGRVLGAANAALPWPDDDLEVLWQAATVLREHRGDGHVAALLTAGLDGPQALVWRTALVPDGADLLRAARGWTDQEVSAGADQLRARGWLTADGVATDRARQAADEIELITDRLAAGPWDRLGERRTERCAELLGPIADRAMALLPYPNPIGLPPPR